MKRTLLWILIGIFFFALFIGFTVGESYLISIPLPTSDREALAEELVEFAANQDWEEELRRAGWRLRARNDVFAPLRQRAPVQKAPELRYRLKVEQWARLVDPPRGEDGRTALVWLEKRLELESRIRSLARAVDDAQRRERIWEIYGSGFDSRARSALAAEQSRRPDPWLEDLIRRLDSTAKDAGEDAGK